MDRVVIVDVVVMTPPRAAEEYDREENESEEGQRCAASPRIPRPRARRDE